MSYELGWRRLADPTLAASRAVMRQLGDKLLSSAKYIYRQNTFDNDLYPSSGE